VQCVGFVDFLTCLRLQYYGFAFRRTAFLQFLKIFPVRPFTLFPTKRSPARRLTYWHRPHTSLTRKPVVFIHGIGIGLYPYVNLLAQLDSRLNSGSSSDDLVGIIAIEIMPVSFRITHSALKKDEMCDEILAILKYHKFHQPVLVSHSYGTVITTQLLKSPELADQIGPIVLIDPISILLHLPDVAYNFTRRKPQRANEHQLYYFASMDMGVSHSLSRCFFWCENVLWKNDIGHRPVTVSLAGQDLIVNTRAVGDYLASHNGERVACKIQSTNGAVNGSIHEKTVALKDGFANNIASGNAHENTISENGNALTSLHQRSNGYVKSTSNGYVKSTSNGHVTGKSNGHVMGTSTALSGKTLDDRCLNAQQCAGWEDRTWSGDGVDIMWFGALDHAQVFDKANTRERLVKAISEYSSRVC
jgi:pimeloyl-ACP methyl ester carboxylesterase